MTARRTLLAAFVVALFPCGVASTPVASAASGHVGSPLPARMLVYAQEWALTPSRATLPAGNVTVQLWNRGEDAHDLRIRRVDGAGAMVGLTQAVALTQSGGLHQSTWKLSAGTYEMYCSLPGHLMRGMHVRIRVR
jgi:hypothetical protein